jgi:hypothetical protein
MAPWLPYALGGVVGVAVLAFVIGSLTGGDSTAESSTTVATSVATTEAGETTTSSGATTTSAPEETTTSEGTTTSSTTTTIPAWLIEDRFDGTTAAKALFPSGVMSLEVESGMGVLAAHQGGVVPALYSTPVSEPFSVSMEFRIQKADDDGAGGVVILSEDPSDSAITHYLLVYVVEARDEVWVAVWTGAWDVTSYQLAGTGYIPEGFNLMTVGFENGQLEVAINDVVVGIWTGTPPATSGHVGFVVLGNGNGDQLTVDNYLVLEG